MQTIESLSKVLKTVGNPKRLKLMVQLLQGEQSVSELEAQSNIPQPNLSHELKRLRDAMLVNTRRESKIIYYSIVDQSVAAFISNLVASTLDPRQSIVATNNFSMPVHALATKTPTAMPKNGEYGDFPKIVH